MASCMLPLVLCSVHNLLTFFHLFTRYYHKIPEEVPELPHGQVYGLASPDDFSLPPHHQLWSEEVYAAFEAPAPDKKEEPSATPVRNVACYSGIVLHVVLIIVLNFP